MSKKNNAARRTSGVQHGRRPPPAPAYPNSGKFDPGGGCAVVALALVTLPLLPVAIAWLT